MKIIACLLITGCVWKIVKCDNKTKFEVASFNRNFLSDALCAAAETFVKAQIVLNVISTKDFGQSAKDFEDEFLSKISRDHRIILRIFYHEVFALENGRIRRGSVFVIRDFSDFMEIYETLTPERYKFNGYFLIVLLNEIDEVHEIFKLLWIKQIYNVIVMHESENHSVLMKSFEPFRPGKCDDTTPIVVDEFKNGNFKFGNDLLPNKLKDLHNCEVRVSISNDTQPFVIAILQPNGSYALSGRDISLVTSLAESLNFRINYTFIGPIGFLFENGTAKGPLKALLDGQADISLNNWFLKISRLKFLASTTSYLSDLMVFVIPPGQELSCTEKMIFPFSAYLWLSIILGFVIGWLVIFVIKRQSKDVQIFVFGADGNGPYMNMCNGFLGGGWKVLPKGSFGRFLLMMFLMYSLIIRAAYQGAFYDLLRSNIRKKEVQSIDEMFKRDFTYFAQFSTLDLLTGTELSRKRL